MSSLQDSFQAAYKALNAEQKRAVDTIDGPVMVIAGPGTGKTQVLAVRIANILNSDTQTKPEEVLCLTFTNAGVKAMRERLIRMIGPTASRVMIATFHSFAMSQVEKFYPVLGYETAPTILDDIGGVVLFDELLHSREWRHVPRINKGKYVSDARSLISNLKQQDIGPEMFRADIDAEIAMLKNDPSSISSQGATKGQMKKDVEKKIESLERSREVSDLYEQYEQLKEQRHIIDYHDVLKSLVRIMELSDEARDGMRENFQYVLVDEHQDSSGIQNRFLEVVWQDSPVQPNIFVVGDDRQLIFGFGGASLDYFTSFKHVFGKAELITLTKNYRSSQTILDTAEALLQSTLAEGKLVGNTDSAHKLQLIEADYPRDEILSAGLFFKRLQQDENVSYDDCAILVPTNRYVKSSMQTLRDMGLPVAAATSLQLFELPDTQAFLTVLRLMAEPFDYVSLSRTLLDPISGIEPMAAHEFLFERYLKKLTIADLIADKDSGIRQWGEKLQAWIALSRQRDAYGMIQVIAEDCLLGTVNSDADLRRRIEIIRTLLHVALMQVEQGEQTDIGSFVAFIERLREYDEDLPLAVFGADKGIKVLTLHKSKGLEFDAVWIAHMDEKSLLSSKRRAFVIPESIEEKIEEQDTDVKKRQLYVAITRAKRFCAISYSRHGYTGGDQQLANIIAEMPQELFDKKTLDETEHSILETDDKLYVASQPIRDHYDVTELVAEEYKQRKVSVTMLNNFYECPWQWYFRSLLMLPESETNPLQIGTVVHAGISEVLKGNKRDEAIAQCAKLQARNNEEQANFLIKEATPIVAHWQQAYYPQIDHAKEIKIEEKWKYIDPEVPDLEIEGKIDLLEEVAPETVKVSDWKTGGTHTGNEIEKRDEEGRLSHWLRQLAMYSYLVSGASQGKTAVSESRLVFLEAKKGDKNAVYSHRVTEEEIALLRRDIADYGEMAKNGSWISRPCQAKTYGQQDECQYCALAKRYGIFAEKVI